MSNIRTLQLQPHYDYTPHLAHGVYTRVSIGFDHQLYWLSPLHEPDYRHVAENGVSFAKIIPDQAQAYRVQAFTGAVMTLDVTLKNVPMNIHSLQPLPNKELLLVCSRSQYRGKDDFDKNALVYSHDGEFLRNFLLGDGIGRVQTTQRGIIWTGYFDEGVFGNYGWDGGTFNVDTGKYCAGPKPVGRDGLLAWNAHGKTLYRFRPTEAMTALEIWDISDCYALNVASSQDTWLYYYHSFPLVHIHKRKIVNFWQIPVAGSGMFAIADDHALFSGGYKHRNVYYLLALGETGSKAKIKSKFRLLDEKGEPLLPEQMVSKGDTLYLLRNKQLYLLTVGLALNS